MSRKAIQENWTFNAEQVMSEIGQGMSIGIDFYFGGRAQEIQTSGGG